MANRRAPFVIYYTPEGEQKTLAPMVGASRQDNGTTVEMTMKANEKDQVIERLRVSRVEGRERRYQAGVEAGADWAKWTAEAAELGALTEFDAALSEPWTDHLAAVPTGELGGTLYRITHPDTREGQDEVAEFWADALGDDTAHVNNSDFAAGFVEGALGVWSEVEKEVGAAEKVGK